MTLIEVMITVAVLGLVIAAGADGVVQTRKHSALALQRERALQVLEYEAAALVTGKPVDPAISRELLMMLPAARFESRGSGGVRTLRVTWVSPRGGETQRELVLMETPR
jgi:prepilin-type N-terminal cleavage/methylation domain-containing protein